MTIRSLRWASAACLFLAAIFGTSLARANVLSFGPSQGVSDSPYFLSGSLTYSGSTLTAYDVKVTTSTNPLVYEWTSASGSTFLINVDNSLVISNDGQYHQGPPSLYIVAEQGGPLSGITTTTSVDWQFFV